ncbi:MAG: hypothetical protein ABJH98_10680 [Reichenbachiella sp.]|uniref:hypothetical protein n=1 Tax=Reichenbachiella sp. TaxID=2184521 RepID=UPI003298F255
MKKGLLKSLYAAGVITLVVANSNELKAQSKMDTMKKESSLLTAPNPIVAPSGEALKASVEAPKISVIININENDPISEDRYAKGFANGFASREKTGDKPIYLTAVSVDERHDRATSVSFLINGHYYKYEWQPSHGEAAQEFDGKGVFPVDFGSKLIPLVMNKYVADHGYAYIIP